jgi:Fic-DOC domain mobile mystery protein B
VTDLFQEPPDATELPPTEREGLLQTWITTRAELNTAEEHNILDGANWARRRRAVEATDLLNDDFAKSLHKQMFGDVWVWAGTYRLRESNLGVAPPQIPIESRTLFDDARYWLQHQTYSRDELAVRVHHRLVAIHPFPNGNGRHTRLMADFLVERLGGESFTWGGGGLNDAGQLRARYIAALKLADGHDIGPLLGFARS